MVSAELSELATTSQCVDCGKTHPSRAALIPSSFRMKETLPTVSETAAIHDFVRSTDAEIACKERNIVALTASINQLLCEVAQLRRSSDQHKAIIAPIRRVPPEVMAEIFMQLAEIEADMGKHSLALEFDDYIIGKPYMVRPRPHRTPLIFGEICREWRTIALSSPRLWNTISLQCSTSGANLQANIRICETWLKRPGTTLPLSIRFSQEYQTLLSRRPHTQQNIDRTRKLIAALLPYASRWRFLDLDGLPFPSYQVLDSLPPGSVPRLEYLSVNYKDSRLGGARSMLWAGFQIAPKLTHLYFDNIGGANITILGEQPTFPWSQLTFKSVIARQGIVLTFWPKLQPL
ncbi:hypothetical protein C8R44DRAFT_181715 [Mycena epipterygia]|nr:hypothetical protein C8R44DRAFT_181715 [Mycena epipterygia]